MIKRGREIERERERKATKKTSMNVDDDDDGDATEEGESIPLHHYSSPHAKWQS